MKRLLLLTVLVLGPAACGSDDDEVASNDPDTPVTQDPSLVDPGPGTDPGAGGAAILTPTPGLDNPNPAAIDSVHSTADNKLEVRFYNGVQECYGVDRVEVVETDTEVSLTVFTGSLPGNAARVCIDLAQLQAVAVTLDAPLGERAVVDGSSGAPVAVGSSSG